MDRTKCSLSDSELIEKVQDELSKMCQTGGKSFTMRIPAKVNEDTDLLISEMVARFKELSVKTVKLDAVVIHRLLEQKEAVYNDICAWFETEYDSNTDKDTLAEYEKNAIEIKAQIKLLNYLIYDVKD